jgi:serine/threonine-protein kinase
MVLPVPDCSRCRTTVTEMDARFCPNCGQVLTAKPASRVDPGAVLSLGYGEVVLGEILGEGGMGIVRKGWLHYSTQGSRHGTPDHPVAVKLLSPLLKTRERARRLFIGEAMALDRIAHPNIVHFFGMPEFQGQLAIVMEWVDGEPLSEVIQRHRRTAVPGGLPCMPMVPVWHIFSQLLGALAATHALQIVHRDVKPSNILIRRDGMVKLTDFGIARVPTGVSRQSAGMAPGTGAYMSPEQVTATNVDARSDLYSAATVLFEMLTGRTPFDVGGRSELSIRTAQLEEPPPRLSALVPQAPPILDLLLSRALAKSQSLRFSSAIELGEALRESLGLPDTPGWQAQKRLAGATGRHSRSAAAPLDHTEDEAEALRLRTDVMQAYTE